MVLTSSKDDKDLIEGYGLHANSYVCKPIGFEKFVEAVRQLKFYWLILNEPPPKAESASSEPLPRGLSDRT